MTRSPTTQVTIWLALFFDAYESCNREDRGFNRWLYGVDKWAEDWFDYCDRDLSVFGKKFSQRLARFSFGYHLVPLFPALSREDKNRIDWGAIGKEIALRFGVEYARSEN